MRFKNRRFERNERKKWQDLRIEQENLLTEQSDFFLREAYKTMRTNVMFSLTEENRDKVILVTSSFSGDGKSFTAANLAISFAQADKKVLLIDCDLRRPRLAQLLNMKATAGLSNILVNPKLIQEAILPSKEKNLKVILSGDIPPNPSELLGSLKMQKFLGAIRQRFDYIILDTSPVNLVTDAAVLAPISDGVLFVVRAGKSERGSVMRALDQLKYTNSKVLGFVLNGVDRNGSKYNNYGGERYRYRQYREYSRSDESYQNKIGAITDTKDWMDFYND